MILPAHDLGSLEHNSQRPISSCWFQSLCLAVGLWMETGRQFNGLWTVMDFIPFHTPLVSLCWSLTVRLTVILAPLPPEALWNHLQDSWHTRVGEQFRSMTELQNLGTYRAPSRQVGGVGPAGMARTTSSSMSTKAVARRTGAGSM